MNLVGSGRSWRLRMVDRGRSRRLRASRWVLRRERAHSTTIIQAHQTHWVPQTIISTFLESIAAPVLQASSFSIVAFRWLRIYRKFSWRWASSSNRTTWPKGTLQGLNTSLKKSSTRCRHAKTPSTDSRCKCTARVKESHSEASTLFTVAARPSPTTTTSSSPTATSTETASPPRPPTSTTRIPL